MPRGLMSAPGRFLDPPATEDLKTYPIRQTDDEIEIKLD